MDDPPRWGGRAIKQSALALGGLVGEWQEADEEDSSTFGMGYVFIRGESQFASCWDGYAAFNNIQLSTGLRRQLLGHAADGSLAAGVLPGPVDLSADVGGSFWGFSNHNFSGAFLHGNFLSKNVLLR